MGSLYEPKPREEESHSRPLIIAAIVVIAVGVLLWVYARSVKPTTSTQLTEAPYASNLQISNLHLSTAENFVGGSVTYLEGTIANTGTSIVTSAEVQVIFRNSLGEVVGRPVVPLMVSAATLGTSDFVPLSKAPLRPNQQVGFRLTFEHISADWNMGLPELRVVKAVTK